MCCSKYMITYLVGLHTTLPALSTYLPIKWALPTIDVLRLNAQTKHLATLKTACWDLLFIRLRKWLLLSWALALSGKYLCLKKTYTGHSKQTIYLCFYFFNTKWACYITRCCWKTVLMDIYLAYTHSDLSKGIPVYVHPMKIHILFPFKAVLIHQNILSFFACIFSPRCAFWSV